MCGGYGGQYHSVVSSKATKQTVTNHRKSVPRGMNDILGTPFAGPHSYNLGGKSVQQILAGFRKTLTLILISLRGEVGADNAILENAGLELSGTGNVWNATSCITYSQTPTTPATFQPPAVTLLRQQP